MNSLLFGAGAMLMGHLGSVHWLAKDLVWVLPDQGCDRGFGGGGAEGLKRWLMRYQMPQKVIESAE